jgi:hypothetical protein
MKNRNVKVLVSHSPDGTAESFKVLVRTDRYDYCRIPVKTMEDAVELAGHVMRLRKSDDD